ncbi:Ig-like domain-containing protein [Mucilaginibacter sp. L196]|uniref:Ig-like domain-containing protein n=1 Tax=Mucilaginibacter sp. L196 TaxID=1641870 RepID=UPI001C208043|nr:Ig-like domain-containing protein [Mucilaginibacter sp. L196]
MFSGCANIQRPMGGPKDVTPPRLLKATPPNMSRNFNSKIIQLDFDEYFKLSNQYTEISMSPAQDKSPEYKIKSKSLVIVLKDTLQKNTTYVINFGKAIADVNEGNILKNFTYVFSTGPHIDSLSVSGTVTNTLTQKREKDVTVMLFPIEKDSLYFGKKKPSIYATTDTAGNFSLNNLHDGDYRIYALEEKTPDRIYNKDDELIAFQKQPVHLYADTSGIQLYLFKQEPAKFHLAVRKFDQDGKLFFVFNKRLNNPSVKIIYPPALDDQKIVEFSPTKDTANIYMKNMDFDSIRVAFFDNNKPLDSASLLKGRKESFTKNYTFRLNLSSNNKLKPTSDLMVIASYPIASYDPSQITLYEDSVAVNNLNIIKDTTNLKRYIIKYKWKEDSRYIFVADEGAFTFVNGDKNKKYQKSFLVDKIENYSTLTIKVTVPDTSKQYLVEVYQDADHIIRTDKVTKNASIVYKNFLTGKYSFKVVYDDNHNGKWDSGDVKQKRYPENIWVDPVQITLRPNWDAEEKLDIPKEQILP